MCLPSDGPQLPFSPSLLPRDPVALQSDDTCGGGRCRDPSFRTSGSSRGALSSSEQWLPSLASQRFLTSPPHGDLGRRYHSCHPPRLRPPSRTPGNVKGGPLLLCQRFRSGSEVGQGARSRDAVPGTTSVLPATPALAGRRVQKPLFVLPWSGSTEQACRPCVLVTPGGVTSSNHRLGRPESAVSQGLTTWL